jgi:hypothetical protein
MLKLSSAAVGKIVLGQDFHHFDSLDAPMHRLPMAIAESLVLNKKVSTMGEWYSHLPFGDPKKLRDLGQEIADTIITSMKEAKGSGTEDLPLQEAALKAADVWLSVDPNGKRQSADVLQIISTEPSTQTENAYQSKTSFQR